MRLSTGLFCFIENLFKVATLTSQKNCPLKNSAEKYNYISSTDWQRKQKVNRQKWFWWRSV